MMHLLLVCAGGAIGAGLRHLANMVLLRWFGPGFPWGTMAVNVSGSLVMGFFAALLARKLGASTEWRLFFATGILGGYTTFSAFSLETVNLWLDGREMAAAAYVAVSVIFGLLALCAGLWFGRSLL
ncbi:fluoride efflux transporter CrcB [Limoniibacter endophyticus]|uniref:Fluoride-specific ion channel FluC n=1 Tax=Limoniibacter endophyticus TaxID=1565040 RepID=A0A8J3DG16_9HYPH|nr:fluoride efflux transporter CrcB [Limoniibacter endophyticus]GHC63151.1 putative fluoride ion transporter CrcB [Limoniibacter endophyticus]